MIVAGYIIRRLMTNLKLLYSNLNMIDMKLKTLLLIVALTLSVAAYASGPVRYFKEYANMDGVEYSYISPQMMKTKGEIKFSSGESGRTAMLSADEVRMLEMVKLTDSEIFKGIDSITKRIIDDNSMELLVTSKNEGSRYEVYVQFSKEPEFVSKILIILVKQSGSLPRQGTVNNYHAKGSKSGSYKVVYLEGAVNLADFGTVLFPKHF